MDVLRKGALIKTGFSTTFIIPGIYLKFLVAHLQFFLVVKEGKTDPILYGFFHQMTSFIDPTFELTKTFECFFSSYAKEVLPMQFF